jgi:hypothetical protein
MDSAEKKKMILSIQLISADSGEPIVDSVITGNSLELGSQMTELLGQNILMTSNFTDHHAHLEQVPQQRNGGSDGLSLVPPPPIYSSKGGFAGGSGDVNSNFKLSGANAGIQGGERTKPQQVSSDGVAFDNSIMGPYRRQAQQ